MEESEKTYVGELKDDEAELKEVKKNILREEKRLKTNKAELKDATEDLKDKTKECKLFVERYNRETKQREGEIKVLKQVA